jgi:hypothetical protein
MTQQLSTPETLRERITYWEQQEINAQRALAYAQRQSQIHIGELATLGYMVNDNHELEETLAQVIQFPIKEQHNENRTSNQPEPA